MVQISSDWFIPGREVTIQSFIGQPSEIMLYVLNGPCYLFAFFVPVFLLGSKGFEVSKNNGRKTKKQSSFSCRLIKKISVRGRKFMEIALFRFFNLSQSIQFGFAMLGNASENEPRLVPNYESTWPASHN